MKEANLGIDIELSDLLNSIFGKRFVYNYDLTAATGFVIDGKYQATCEYYYNSLFLFSIDVNSINAVYNYMNFIFRSKMQDKGIDIDLRLNDKQKAITCNLYKHG